LITLFYVAGAPLVLLALIFISLTASIAVQQEEQEIATMRGRGVSWAHVYALNLAESLVLVTLAIPFSLLLGWLLSVLMGKTQLFLQFTRQADLTFSLRDINLGWVGLFCLLVFASRLLPLLGLRRTTTVIIKQEKSRSLKKPLWERFFLDFILMVPALYVYWLLRSQAKPVKVLTDLKVSGSQGQYDPLMFLASSLFAVSACMIVLRFFPLLMRLLAAISDRVSRAGPYLAIQEIYRRAREHVSVMLLIMISLSLAIFSSSMATTLDQWMHDSQYYQAGSDLVVKEYAIPLNASMSQPIPCKGSKA
jgi:putative ABC transport system permease protein